ncbi:hypothetical protein [Photobacterium leiognathi]|uniref:hypothetical protein n=1 Tax=Photobacterium leiognathi TaxID=553611 RepID=UPI0027333B88|nr:hypothetical protein [Photobacterium leiognathi]
MFFRRCGYGDNKKDIAHYQYLILSDAATAKNQTKRNRIGVFFSTKVAMFKITNNYLQILKLHLADISKCLRNIPFLIFSISVKQFA